MKRTRECDSPAPANGGETCPGDRSQSEGCNKDPCPQGIELYIIITSYSYWNLIDSFVNVESPLLYL